MSEIDLAVVLPAYNEKLTIEATLREFHSVLPDAYFVVVDNTVVSAMESMVQVAEQRQRLLVTSDPDSVQRGAAAALATDYRAQGVQTAGMIARIIEGADPASTPVEFAESLELSVNPAAAERMGVTLPDEVLEQAATTY